jgi:hypothetical protein
LPRSSASTNASTARTGLLSSIHSSRHSGNKVDCPRSAPTKKRFIDPPQIATRIITSRTFSRSQGHSRRLSDILGMSASPSTPAVLRTAANRCDCQEETSRPFCVHPQPRVVLFESCQRDVPKSCFRSGSGDAVGGHHTGHSFFLPVRAAFTVPVRTGACARNLRTQGGMQ